MIKRTHLSSVSPADLQGKDLVISDYSEISNYTIDHQLIPVDVLRKLREDMGFDQLRFYCFKKTVGRVFHIKTALNQLGEAVVQHYTVMDVVSDQPKACGSFEVFNDDTSVLSPNCSKWGRPSSELFEQDKWGSYRADGRRRMFYCLAQIGFSHSVQMRYYSNAAFYSCDDPIAQNGQLFPKPLSIGDTWKVFVR